MPRTSFTGSLIDGASSGLGRLAKSLATGQGAYQDAYDHETNLQTRMAQALAQQMRADAESKKAAEETRGLSLKNDNLARLPDLADEQAAYGSGTSVPLVRAVRDAVRTGGTAYIPGVEMDGPNPDGSAGVPALVPEEQRSRIVQQLQRTLPVMLSEGKLAAGDWAKAAETYGNVDLRDAVLNGSRRAEDVGRAQAAEKGSELFKSGSDGQVLDIFAGGVNVNNPVAQAGLKFKAAQTDAQYANAQQSRAAALKSKEEVDRIIKGGGGITDPSKRFEAENKLRDEYQKASQPYVLIRDAFGKVQAAAKDPTAAGDIALLYAYMKILDPTSVVREGEFATAQNAGGVSDRIVNAYNKALKGTRLNDQQRADLVNQAKKIHDQQDLNQQLNTRNYGQLARNYGLSPDNILTPYNQPQPQPAAQPAPAPGTPPGTGPKVVRTGTVDGRKVVQFEDGTVQYADGN